MTRPDPPARSPDDDADEQLGYEQTREQLAQVVQRLESGGVPLDESLALWQRGERLAQICQRWLDGARATIDAARAAEEQTQSRAAGPPERGRSADGAE